MPAIHSLKWLVMPFSLLYQKEIWMWEVSVIKRTAQTTCIETKHISAQRSDSSCTKRGESKLLVNDEDGVGWGGAVWPKQCSIDVDMLSWVPVTRLNSRRGLKVILPYWYDNFQSTSKCVLAVSSLSSASIKIDLSQPQVLQVMTKKWNVPNLTRNLAVEDLNLLPSIFVVHLLTKYLSAWPCDFFSLLSLTLTKQEYYLVLCYGFAPL